MHAKKNNYNFAWFKNSKLFNKMIENALFS